MPKKDNSTGDRNGKFNKNVQDAEREFREKMNKRELKNSHMTEFEEKEYHREKSSGYPHTYPELTRNASTSSKAPESLESYEYHSLNSQNRVHITEERQHDFRQEKRISDKIERPRYDSSTNYTSKIEEQNLFENESSETKTYKNFSGNELTNKGNNANPDAEFNKGYLNKNVQDAQAEYDEKMHEHPIRELTNSSDWELQYEQASEIQVKNPFEGIHNEPGIPENSGDNDFIGKRRNSNSDIKLTEGYLNKNVQDAQREYDEKMHKRPNRELGYSVIEEQKSETVDAKSRNPFEDRRSKPNKDNDFSVEKRKKPFIDPKSRINYLDKGKKNIQEEQNNETIQSSYLEEHSESSDPQNRNPFTDYNHSLSSQRNSEKNISVGKVGKSFSGSNDQRAYLNKNIQDAQREYDEKMHRHPGIDKIDREDSSAYHTNAENKEWNGREENGDSFHQKTRKNGDYKVPEMFSSNRKRTILDIKNTENADNLIPHFDESEIDLNDIPGFKGKTPTSIGHKIAKIERQFAKLGIHFGEATATQGSNTAVGYRFTKELSAVAVMTIINNTKVTLSNSMNYTIGKHMDKYYDMVKNIKNPRIKDLAFIGRPRRVQDINRMIYSLNVLLKEQGYAPVKGNGKIGIINAMKILSRHKGKMTPEMQEVYKLIIKLFQNQTMMQGGGRFTALRRFGMQKIRRYAMQCNAGQGLIFTSTVTARAINTLRMGWRFIKSTAKMTHFATLSAAKVAAWGAAKVAKNKMAAKIAEKGKAVVTKHVSDGVRKTVKKGATNVKNGTGKLGNLFRRAKNRYNQFRIDPFHIKGGTRKAIQAANKKIWNSKLGKKLMKPVKIAGKVFNPFRIVGNIIGRALVMVSTLVSTIISILFLILVMIIFAFIAVIIVTIIAESIIQWFDFSLNEEEIKKAAFKQIKDCYEAQNREIQGYYSQFRNVTVSYRDVKNEEIYKKYKPEVPFTETTNSAELLCMAQVYFDFDLEDAGEYKVKDYIRQLYNGSHTTSIVKHKYVVKDEDGKEITYVDADITLTTYYFDSLFSCSLSNSYGTISGNEVSEQVWNYFRTAGFSEEATAGIMGNLYQESGMNPSRLQNGVGPAAGICQMETYMDYSTRWGTMAKKAEAKGKNWTDLESQLEFMIDDMPGQFKLYTGRKPHYYSNGEWCWWPEKLTINDYKNLTDIDKATEIFERVFERASKPNMQRRITASHDYYNTYKGTMPEAEEPSDSEESSK